VETGLHFDGCVRTVHIAGVWTEPQGVRWPEREAELHLELALAMLGGKGLPISTSPQATYNYNNNNKWSTKLQLKTNQELIQSRLIKINRGIFQGDSLSPLLFCIALVPLTHELNRSKCGYQVYGTERKIHHLLYTDDREK
jgi:hypothetical protein